jgi:Bacterial transcriptional activator domain
VTLFVHRQAGCALRTWLLCSGGSASGVLWVRLGPEDHDPGSLLVSLATTVEQLLRGSGHDLLDLARRCCGPAVDWLAAAGEQDRQALGLAVQLGVAVAELEEWLGRFSAMLNDVPVEGWPGARSRSLCKYLLPHREPGVPRDVLMETFWPNSAPEAARNSLHVAVHGLRRTSRAASDIPVVVHDGGIYTLHPDLRVWIDTEEFERCFEAGQRLEAAGDLAGATADYETAVTLYHGEFVAEEPGRSGRRRPHARPRSCRRSGRPPPSRPGSRRAARPGLGAPAPPRQQRKQNREAQLEPELVLGTGQALLAPLSGRRAGTRRLAALCRAVDTSSAPP